MTTVDPPETITILTACQSDGSGFYIIGVFTTAEEAQRFKDLAEKLGTMLRVGVTTAEMGRLGFYKVHPDPDD